MIVVDTSALIEMIMLGPRADECRQALMRTEAIYISAGSFTETLIVSAGKGLDAEIDTVRTQSEIEIAPVTVERAQAAGDAYRQWGKGWHPARLNFGDCFAYALAKELDCPLLFVGNDFAQTDVKSALG
ncbi:MAG: type II toxin-antitoxin system VapC family toxin [Pacificimonas sp.]